MTQTSSVIARFLHLLFNYWNWNPFCEDQYHDDCLYLGGGLKTLKQQQRTLKHFPDRGDDKKWLKQPHKVNIIVETPRSFVWTHSKKHFGPLADLNKMSQPAHLQEIGIKCLYHLKPISLIMADEPTSTIKNKHIPDVFDCLTQVGPIYQRSKHLTACKCMHKGLTWRKKNGFYSTRQNQNPTWWSER